MESVFRKSSNKYLCRGKQGRVWTPSKSPFGHGETKISKEIAAFAW